MVVNENKMAFCEKWKRRTEPRVAVLFLLTTVAARVYAEHRKRLVVKYLVGHY